MKNYLEYKKGLSKGFFIFSFSLFIIMQIACTKTIGINSPITSINSDNVYNSDATASAVLTGIYAKMSLNGLQAGGLTSISFFSGLSSDELSLYKGATDLTLIQYYRNSLTNSLSVNFWNNIYPIVFVTNSILEGLKNTAEVSPVVKDQLIGEAKFIRAFCYFYLLNLYGDIPLITSTDYKVNSVFRRTPKVQVWESIINDLKDAQKLLSNNYLDGNVLNETNERVRPTKWAATAILARVYLYTNNWIGAEEEASSIINNTGMYKLSEELDDVFLLNSEEAIWQLQPVNAGWNVEDARTFIIQGSGPNSNNPVYLSKKLLSSFELGDKRKSKWVKSIVVGDSTYYYVYKYKSATYKDPISEYNMVLRLSEQYLIRAEARAQQENISQAVNDLNIIRNRANLVDIKTTSQSEILIAIQHERQVELFTEWGHRWLDMKRTQTIDTIMNNFAIQKGGLWSSNWQLYPIPREELRNNPNLIQNEGYN